MCVRGDPYSIHIDTIYHFQLWTLACLFSFRTSCIPANGVDYHLLEIFLLQSFFLHICLNRSNRRKKKKKKASLAINKLSIMLTNFSSKKLFCKKVFLSLSLSSRRFFFSSKDFMTHLWKCERTTTQQIHFKSRWVACTINSLQS